MVENESAEQGWQRVGTLYLSEDPNPYTTNPRKEWKHKIVEEIKKEQIRLQEGIGAVLTTHLSHTIKQWDIKIVP